MRIKQLELNDFRNFHKASLKLSPGFNGIYGANGAGKTSILEAAFCLGHGRSFRSRHAEPLIKRSAEEFLLFSRLNNEDDREVSVGLARSAHGAPRIHIDGKDAQAVADLARIFPTLIIDSASTALVDEGPGHRRSYLDWGVFHVEHRPAALWAQFRRILQQRNALLKSGRLDDLEFWDQQFVASSEELHAARASFINKLEPAFQGQVRQLLGDNFDLTMTYHSGWRHSELSLEQILKNSRDRDRVLGRTSKGAHCADLIFEVANTPAKEILSRGQKKLLVIALKFAQMKLYNSSHDERCCLLLDDLPAELDPDSQEKVCAALKQFEGQILATAIYADELSQINPSGEKNAMFHVEHGQITEIKSGVS